MSRTRESGAYLGGIGVMLGEADICPLCGESHPESLFTIRHGNARECPKVVLGSFPVLDRAAEEATESLPVAPAFAGRRIREFETPLPLSLASPLPPPPEEANARPRGLGVPWLRPPDLGGIL